MAEARKPLISGNWKMNLNHFEATAVVQKLVYELTAEDYAATDVSIHPPFTDIRTVQTYFLAEKEPIPLLIGAQNCHWEEKGAFTGEVSPPMLAKLNVDYVIVGHSERRELFGETDEALARKVPALLDGGLEPILCVGESEEERERGETERKLRHQVQEDLEKVADEQLAEVVIAYEPIWAIGTGKVATPEQAQEASAFVRALVGNRSEEAAERLRVLYGGSVKPDNADEILSQPDVDGALVGGASQDPEGFARIVAAA